MGILDEIEQDRRELPNDEALKKVSTLAKKQLQLENEVEMAELAWEQKKAELAQVRDKDIPSAMAEVGISSFTLDDDSVVTVKLYYSAKIDDDNREQAFEWLEANGHGDIIKHTIGVALGRGEDEMAKLVVEALEKIGVSYTDKNSVHYQTLVAFIREQVEKGAEVPLDTFKAYIGQTTKIKRPK